MNSLVILAAALSTTLPCPQLSSSDVLRIAHAIANYAGYRSSGSHEIEYELTDEPGHNTYSGYTTVQMRNNLQTVYDLSINNSTGQVVDFNRCLVFRYPVIRGTESQLHFYKSLDLSYSKIMGRNGCERYRVLRRPNDAGKERTLYPVDQK